MVKILAIDPGVHTGWAIYDSDKLLVDNVNQARGCCGQFVCRGWRQEAEVGESIAELISRENVRVLAIEDFILMPTENKERDGLSAVRVTAFVDGAVLRMAKACGGVYSDHSNSALIGDSGVMRKSFSASVAKNTWTDKRLKEIGIWKGFTAHERDAWRHALTVAKSAGLIRRS